jgi:hypothetical protein
MNNLGDRAVLVSLSTRAWRATAADREIAKQTENEYQAAQGTMKVVKDLVPRSVTAPIFRIIDYGRSEHYRLTCLGFTKGQQLLSTALFDRYCITQNEIREGFNFAVQRLCEMYPEVLEEAPKRLGNAFKISDFPTVEQLPGYFYYKSTFAPIPSTEDWRLEGLAEGDMTEVRRDVEESIHSMYQEATKEIYERAREVLKNIASQARSYESTFGGSSLLRNATIENLKDVSGLICQMNITNDPVLTEIGEDMVKEFSQLEGEELRKDAKQRESIATIAERLMKKME